MPFLKAAKRAASSSGATISNATFTINSAAKGLLIPAPREASRNASSSSSLMAVKSNTKSCYPLQFWPAQVFSGRGVSLTLADHASRREEYNIYPHNKSSRAVLLEEIAGHRLERSSRVPRASLNRKERRACRSRVVVRSNDRVTRAVGVDGGGSGGGARSAIDALTRGGRGGVGRRVLSVSEGEGLARIREENAAVDPHGDGCVGVAAAVAAAAGGTTSAAAARRGGKEGAPVAATVSVSSSVESRWKALERMSAEWTVVAKRGEQSPLGPAGRPLEEESGRGAVDVAASAAVDGATRSARMFDGSLREHEQAGQWEKAVELMGQMREVGAHPDVLTYNAAISACARGRQPEQGLALLREMSAEAGVAQDAGSYNAAIRGFEEARRWEQAVVLLREMATVGLTPDAACFGGVVRACGFCGEGEMVRALLTEMLVAGVAPSVACWNAVITACGGGGQWELAVDLLAQMAAAGVSPNLASYSSAVTACGHAGRCEQAVELLRRMSKAGTPPSDKCYRSAMVAAGNGGHCEQVLSLLREMPGVAGLAPKDKDYRAAIAAVGNCGEWREALSLLREMPSIGLVPSLASYNAVVKACTDSGEHGEAAVLLSEMGDAGIARWWVATRDSAVSTGRR